MSYCHLVLLHDGLFPITGEAVTNLPTQRWREKMGRARWGKKARLVSGNKGEKGGQLKGAAGEGQGKLEGTLSPLTGCLSIFLD